MSASPQSAPSRSSFLAPNLHVADSCAVDSRYVYPGVADAKLAITGARAWTVFPALLAAWHLLSLDAPTVAALWLVFTARSARLALPWTESAAMFIAVWILYAADRLLDARGLLSAADQHTLEARHRFHHRHRSGFYAVLIVACPLLALLLRYANPAALRLDLVLGSLLLAWLLLIHGRSSAAPHPSRLPKELAVGLFFPAAVLIPTVARIPELRPALLLDALLLAAVCSLNCLYIFAWEHPLSSRAAHWSTRWAAERLPHLTVTTIVTALAVAALFFCTHLAPHPLRLLALPALACTASAVLLLLLHRNRNQLSPLTLRAAADLCLLTPALMLAAHALLPR